MLYTIISAINTTDPNAYFFGYIGVAAAVIFASKAVLSSSLFRRQACDSADLAFRSCFLFLEFIFVILILTQPVLFQPQKDLGAAYGSAKSGVGICSMGVLNPNLIMKSIIPVIMAGILGIYGMIVAIIIGQKSKF